MAKGKSQVVEEPAFTEAEIAMIVGALKTKAMGHRRSSGKEGVEEVKEFMLKRAQVLEDLARRIESSGQLRLKMQE